MDRERASQPDQAMRYVLGIDAGGSKTVGLLADETGVVRAEARAAGANLLIHGELGVEKTLYEVMEELGAPEFVSASCIGIAGADRPAERETLRNVLHRLGLRQSVQIVSDAAIALVAGAPQRNGVVLVAGTGSIAYGVDSRGNTARSGGWGYLLGDEGSAFWMAQEALKRALQVIDGRGPDTSLVGKLRAQLGFDLSTELMQWMYNPKSLRFRVSRLVPVIQQAFEEGDVIASQIIDEAAHHLAGAAQAVAGRLVFDDRALVILVGGAFRASPSLEARTEQLLRSDGHRVTRLDSEPALGAVTLALDQLA